jgi:hypothetical protein
MPYANIHWIKLKIEILNDKRFIFDCNETQKWLFIGLLLMAGVTKNSVPDDENFLKNRLNLSENSQKIRENLQHLFKIFPKLVSKDGVIKFKNFNEFHNKIGNYFGTPLELQSESKGNKEKIRIEKIRIDKLRGVFLDLKNLDIKNYYPDDFARSARAIVGLLNKAGGQDELVVEGLKWISKQNYEWTLETLIKKWAEFMKHKDTPDILKRWEKKK